MTSESGRVDRVVVALGMAGVVAVVIWGSVAPDSLDRDALPLAAVSAVVAMVLVSIYFVTGADSASIVLGTLSSRGAIRPRRRLVVSWGILIGAVAAALLLAGGLSALQQATVGARRATGCGLRSRS